MPEPRETDIDQLTQNIAQGFRMLCTVGSATDQQAINAAVVITSELVFMATGTPQDAKDTIDGFARAVRANVDVMIAKRLAGAQ